MNLIQLAPFTRATIETRKEQEPDSDGWYTVFNRYALVNCPACGQRQDFNAASLGHGDTVLCRICRIEFAVHLH